MQVIIGGNVYEVVIVGNPDGLAPITVDDNMVAADAYPGKRSVHLFGRNADVDAAEDIWTGGGDYTGFTAAAGALEILSGSALDTAAGTGARTVRVYYLDATGVGFDVSENPLFVDVTLNGVTPVALGVTALRAYKAVVLTAGSGKTNAGDLTVRQVATPSNILVSVPTGVSVSQSTNYTVPLGWTGYLQDFEVSMTDNTANRAIVAIKTLAAGVQTLGNPFSINSAVQYVSRPHGRIVLPELTDMVFRALSVQNANADITISWSMLLIKND